MKHQWFQFLFLLWLVVGVTGCSLFVPTVTQKSNEIEGGDYQLDPLHTTVLFKVNHLNLSTFVGRFDRVHAIMEFNADELASSQISGVIDLQSINVNNPDLETTLWQDWLSADKNRFAQFRSTKGKLINENRYEFEGVLELNNKEHPIVMDVRFEGAADNWLTGFYTIGFSAKTVFKRSDFGIDQFTSFVGDTINVEIFAEFQQRKITSISDWKTAIRNVSK